MASRAASARFDGYILMPVIIMLAIVATVSYLLSLEGVMGSAATARELETIQADFVAEAGFSEAKWRLSQNTSCNGYNAVTLTPFGPHLYQATFTPASGSPVSIMSTGLLSTGAQSVLAKTAKAYQPPTTVVLQPGAAGKDGWLTENKPAWNYGVHPVLRIGDSQGQSSLLEFDLSALPPNAKILSAKLELYLNNQNNSGTANIHVATTAWTEGSCSGAGCTADGATWATTDGAIPWATPGGDFQVPPLASQSVGVAGPYLWVITAVADAWQRGVQPNCGLRIRA